MIKLFHMRILTTFLLFAFLIASSHAMELVWSRGTGQYRCEATPVIVALDNDGNDELLSVNVGGQVMLWNLDGSQARDGQDGTATELPKGEWSSMPLVIDSRADTRIVFGNTSGLFICTNANFVTQWTYQTLGKTQWSRAVPAVWTTHAGVRLVIGDLSGTVTCLDTNGRALWTRAFDGSPIRTFITADDTNERLYVAAGENIHCLNARGVPQWMYRIGGEILSKPELIRDGPREYIVCANSQGNVVALSPSGNELWRTHAGGSIDSSITFWPDDEKSLIVFTGLWGNAYALDLDGQLVWIHHFRSKNRARPLIVDVNGDGRTEMLVAAYNQHLYAFDREGRCVDDVRVAGSVNASPLAMQNKDGGNDVVIVSTTLQAHRFAPALARPIYGHHGPQRGRLFVQHPDNDSNTNIDAIVLDNPSGRFARVNVSAESGGTTHLFSRLSSSDEIVITVPSSLRSAEAFSIEATDPDGSALLRKTVRTKIGRESVPDTSRVHTAGAYSELKSDSREQQAYIGPLYQGEIDQTSLVIHNAEPREAEAAISINTPTFSDGAPFGGTLSVFALKTVTTLNGEQVADALIALPQQSISIAPGDTVQLWIQADSRGALPGKYRGSISVEMDGRQLSPGIIPFIIDVDELQMPRQPLALCTWDYVPNKWFPERTSAVLDDMRRHGVNIFPRSTVPKATYRSKKLSYDWAALDDELTRIKGRGTLLLQVAEPPIDFGANPPQDTRPIKLEYLRALRDHLFAQGWPYDTWALYPVDEPGLDYGGNAQRQVEYGELFRAADPRMRIYTDPVPGLSQRDYDRIAPYVDIWCPNMRLVSGMLVNDARINAIRNSGKPLWSYECVAQVRSLSPLRYNRANAWRADYFGLEGIGFWTHSTTQVDPWITDTTKNDEYALVYPGEVPVSSVRWEAVRDGIEDIGAIRVLEAAIAEAQADRDHARAIEHAADVLRRARTAVMEMADEAYVETRDYLKQGDRQLAHTPWEAQMFLRYRKEIAEATHTLRKGRG
ncbi:MAG: DUF4091 domain-containing protein [Candidatus Hydrogenedentes bacterium]|nr:DUF4091 domain-containing protein [Candidatus Hydrogenedentota bacterium]